MILGFFLDLKIASGGGRPKADDWRNFMKVYPVAVAVAWQLWDKSRDDEAPLPRKKSNINKSMKKSQKLIRNRKIKFISQDPNADEDDLMAAEDSMPNRNYYLHYENILHYCAALRIFISRSITPAEASRAQSFLSEAFQSWASMNCHMVPNFHSAMHLLEYILAYGPVYGWWVWAYEQAIGILSKVNNNGHGGGEVEGTYMRAWWKTIFAQELVFYLAFAHFAVD